MFEDNIYELVNRYKGAGFTPFPLAKKSKVPPKGSILDTIEKDWPFERDSNIGLFPGSLNGLVALDADDNQAKENISAGLKGMGLYEKISIVETPHRKMNHFLLRATNVPMDIGAKYNFPTQIGAGDIRIHRNAYVVAPGSKLPEGQYTFIQGSIESFLAQPIIECKDLLWLLPETSFIKSPQYDGELYELPVRLIYRPNPNALKQLYFLKNAEKHDSIPKIDYITGEILDNHYPTRSEAEFGLIIDLILSGWTYEPIAEVFERELPCHYADEVNPEEYLVKSYNKAITRLTNSDTKYQISTAYRFTRSSPWPGRAGEYNQKVILALLSKAWQYESYTPKISLREISEYTAINRIHTVSNVLERLQKNNLIKIIYTLPYEISQFNIEPYLEYSNNCNINQLIIPPVVNVAVNGYSSYITNEIWSRNLGMFGGSAKLVYTHLSDVPITITQLTKLTGKCWKTVSSKLNRFSKHNLAIHVQDGWVRGYRSIESVAEEFQAEQSAQKRQEQHRRERFSFILRDKSREKSKSINFDWP
jgi:hypothetical protein